MLRLFRLKSLCNNKVPLVQGMLSIEIITINNQCSQQMA